MLLKLSALAAFALALASSAYAQTARPPSASTAPQATSQPPATARISGGTQQRFVPGMARYTDDVLFGDVWVRPQLSPRDRSLVVISVLIATNKPDQLSGHLGRALSNGVTPVEASGALTHLAIYSGWPNAVSALNVYQQVYTSRNVDFAALQAAGAPLPPLDAAATRSLLPSAAARLKNCAASGSRKGLMVVLVSFVWSTPTMRRWVNHSAGLCRICSDPVNRSRP